MGQNFQDILKIESRRTGDGCGNRGFAHVDSVETAKLYICSIADPGWIHEAFVKQSNSKCKTGLDGRYSAASRSCPMVGISQGRDGGEAQGVGAGRVSNQR